MALAVYGFAVLRGLLMVPVGTMNSFWPGVYPAGGLRWRFICGFDFAVLGWRGGVLFGLWAGLWAVSKVESSARASPFEVYPTGRLQ